MDLVGWLALCAVLLALVLAAALAVTAAGRRRLEADQRALRADLTDLRTRLDELAGSDKLAGSDELAGSDKLAEPRDTRRGLATPAHEEPAADYLITTLPIDGPEDIAPVSSGQFASVAVGESLVRIVSLAYGVRRALSPQQRNRIRFEMGREVKRSRRQRRRDLRDARRDLRTRRSVGPEPDLDKDAA